MRAGQLVMLAPPLAVIHAPGEQRPEPSQLVDLLLHSPAAAGSPWLDLLYNGIPKSTKTTPDLTQQLPMPVPKVPVQQQQQLSAPGSAAVKPSSSTSNSAETARSPAGAVRISSRRNKRSMGSSKSTTATHKAAAKQAAKVVAYNSYGEAHSDRAAAACREVPAVGHVGLWPAFALLNHSCAPNTTHWVLGDLMVVRAVTDIAAGEAGAAKGCGITANAA
jgi:SET and MYND domain-containing protein